MKVASNIADRSARHPVSGELSKVEGRVTSTPEQMDKPWRAKTRKPRRRAARAVLALFGPHLVIRSLSDTDHPATASGW